MWGLQGRAQHSVQWENIRARKERRSQVHVLHPLPHLRGHRSISIVLLTQLLVNATFKALVLGLGTA